MAELLTELHREIDADQGRYDRIVKAWHGDNAAAYMSKKSRAALDDTLRKGVNFPALSSIPKSTVSAAVS